MDAWYKLNDAVNMAKEVSSIILPLGLAIAAKTASKKDAAINAESCLN